MILRLLLFFGPFAVSNIAAEIHPDRVAALPGAPSFPDFNLFSGYLNGSSAEADDVPIFYVLAEAIRVDPSTAPLLVWFNGGPGASSLLGFFTEHGPYRVSEEGNLTYHEFSWNQYANVLYLESPLGVGFSQNSNGNITLDDKATATINVFAFQDFMTRVHPAYAYRPYYLTGQSYAGIYVPYFAKGLLHQTKRGEIKNRNFKGFAIGSPVTEDLTILLSLAMKFLANGELPMRFTETVTTNWLKLQRGDYYNVFPNRDLEDAELFVYKEIIRKYIGINSPVHYNFYEHCYSSSYSDEDFHMPKQDSLLGCYKATMTERYLNRVDVQRSLHVVNASSKRTNWIHLNTKIGINYKRESNIYHVFASIFSMVNGSSFRVLIYNGDTDAMITSLSAIQSVARIAASNGFEDQNYDRAWTFYRDFGGIRTGYKNGNTTLDVLTVRGAGHSVPMELPAQAFQLINNFISTEENETIDYSKPIRRR